MKTPSLVAAALIATGTAQAEPVDYTTTPTHTFVHTEVLHGGLSTRRLRFNRAEGRVTIDRAAGRGRVEFSVQTASIATGDATLDTALRAWLGVATHPTARFESDALQFDGERVRALRGTLTLRGEARPLAVAADHFNCYPNPLFKREVCGGEFSAEVDLGRWGATPDAGLGWSPTVTLRVQVEAVRQ